MARAAGEAAVGVLPGALPLTQPAAAVTAVPASATHHDVPAQQVQHAHDDEPGIDIVRPASAISSVLAKRAEWTRRHQHRGRAGAGGDGTTTSLATVVGERASLHLLERQHEHEIPSNATRTND